MTLQQIWGSFQRANTPFQLAPAAPLPNTTPLQPDRFDNPFLINYIVYHHYRSLGWVVKGGIKFCVDYLLYKRGPVFHHAEYVLADMPRTTHSYIHVSDLQLLFVRSTRTLLTGNLRHSIYRIPTPLIGRG